MSERPETRIGASRVEDRRGTDVDNIAADSLYETSYRSTWGAGDGPLGHLVIRRLDDHEVIAEIPAGDEDEARRLISDADRLIRGPAGVFEDEYGIGSDSAADPGPDVAGPPVAEPLDREPDRGERVTTADARLQLFPEPRDVFVAYQQWLAELLHPLVSIELSAIDPAWPGAAHLLSPVDDLLADGDDASNWLVFDVDEHGLFRLRDAEDRFTAGAGHAAGASGEFAATKARWERYGGLVWGDASDPTTKRDGWGEDIALVDQLGGEPGHGNWTAFAPPAGLRLDESDPASAVLKYDDGRPFRFVARTAGYPWREEGADAILLFFEPETRTAALTFDWG
ncbi:hypothetical protein GCM10027591_05660 [Zhihengliuella somnathii]